MGDVPQLAYVCPSARHAHTQGRVSYRVCPARTNETFACTRLHSLSDALTHSHAHMHTLIMEALSCSHTLACNTHALTMDALTRSLARADALTMHALTRSHARF
eukprot:359396-Chlamydomonas_euryale.AAC.1